MGSITGTASPLSSSSPPSTEAALTTAIRVAMECNNVGCDMLAVNDASSAMEFFSVALKLLRTISHLRVDPHSHVDLAKLVTQSRDQVRLFMTSVHSRSCENEATWSSGIKFASRAIKMDFVCSPVVARDNSYIHHNSTILLYNMGLACLVHGAPTMLRKALPLFDMAYKLGIDAFSAATRKIATTTSPNYNDDDSNNNHSAGHACNNCILQRICLDSLHFSAQLYDNNSDFDMAERIWMKLRQFIRQLPPNQDPQEQCRRQFWFLKNLLRKPTLAPAA
jgi:hypothetical protein